ncbi:RHTO0S03e04654g1_1 [Rhodotorula toruloides]|uniref:RHTO0S03e04654g1_1 n=1 Tax=Rhodotorula toruloides TaxID=5286 RepID=A0A061ATU4_RHOTO|nr:RHTO0S03e04654g1_1 [Rhodotorula toruloides]
MAVRRTKRESVEPEAGAGRRNPARFGRPKRSYVEVDALEAGGDASPEPRRSKTRRSVAPSPALKVESEEKKPVLSEQQKRERRKPKEDELKQRLVDAREVQQSRRRPAELNATGVSIFDPASLDSQACLNVSNADTQKMNEVGCFVRKDLASAPQATLVKSDERLATYGSLRLCLLPEKNLGCRSPGRAFVTCDDAEYDINARYTVYVRVSKTARERWQPYGVYKYLWHSFALADDYTRLDDRPDLQEDIIKVFLNYLQRNDIFARWVFENVSLDGTSDETTRYERYVALQAALEEEKRAIIERCLRAGEGLQMFWGVLVWDGPVRQDELRDIMTRRDERRAEEAVEE